MRRRARALIPLVAAVLLASDAHLLAFQSFVPLIDGWTYVEALQPGTFVRVTEAPKHRTTGKLIHADDTTIVVEEGIQPTTIARANVIQVERRLPNHDVRNGFLWGAAIGLGLSAVMVHQGSRGALGFSAFLTFGWGGMGAGGGAVSSLVDREYRVVYLRQ